MPKKVGDLLFEGGDDYANADVDAPPKSKADRKKDKYGGDMDEFSVSKNSKITDGIVRERGCTDIICLGLFIAFLVGMFSVTSYCFAEGQVYKLLAPVDKNYDICGYGTQKGKDYLQFLTTSDNLEAYSSPFSYAICAEKCDDHSHSIAHYCIPYFSGSKESSQVKAADSTFKQSIMASLESNAAGKQILDLYKSSTAIYIASAMAIVFCFAYIYLMSWFAEQIAWTIIGITQVSLYVGCGALIFEYLNVKDSTNTIKKESANAFLAGGIVSGLMALIFTIMLVCGFNQLKIAIDVVDAAADFIRKTKRIVLVPVVYFFLQLAVILVWFFAIICIMSLGDITVDKSGDHQIKNISYTSGKISEKDIYILYMVMFFGLLWILAFLNAQQSFIVMVSGCTYYFDSNKDKDGFAEVSTGVKMAWINHVGSLAMGSFIIAVVEFLRIVVMTITEQATKASGNNPAVKCISCVANCFMACLEKIVDYINKAAYAYMAVSGDGFCSAAWNGFLLNMKHALEFAWANTLAQLFILTGKISLVAVNCGFLYFTMAYITHDLSGEDAVSSPWGPIVLVALITFVAASVFLGLFSNTVLALMTCLSIDVDLNGDPKFGPPTFHDFQRDFKEKRNAIADGGWDKKADDNEGQAANQVA